MRKPNLKEIEEKFELGADFSLSRKQYIELTGVDIPQDKYYTEKCSAIAKTAGRYGYRITVIPEVLQFQKEN